ncbi:hypothetical protein VNO78_05736 [Psophocarpus tetragonolobus]|uniref:Uncharacterized protein n=1 Tax=Psophocarpus tetragonolobus TaxID=3891 RepID=A0AAN9T0F2_PSOTE
MVMAELKLRSSSSKKRVLSGFFKLKGMLEKLQKSLMLRIHKSSRWSNYDHGDTTCVAEDVKEGHFGVIAKDIVEEPKRFVVPLNCLNDPAFLSLLEKAAQEFGFEQHGALTIPCRPCQLEMILAQQWKQKRRFPNKLLKLLQQHHR